MFVDESARSVLLERAWPACCVVPSSSSIVALVCKTEAFSALFALQIPDLIGAKEALPRADDVYRRRSLGPKTQSFVQLRRLGSGGRKRENALLRMEMSAIGARSYHISFKTDAYARYPELLGREA